MAALLALKDRVPLGGAIGAKPDSVAIYDHVDAI